MLPIEIRTEIREMIKNAVLEYLMKRYINELTECRGGLPSIEPAEDGRPVVRIIAVKKGV
ncbi:hypothetical protein MNB_SV-5-1758 [hydrothermal vent metagenome]|uniref:Uncharacterized protein n=1 Tax=hydrothermal vent metagenome TaxID=652676 RepID=A0A1W1EDW5_9ZZZZ